MRIAILGWGSLLWVPDPDFDAWHAPWQAGGPRLPIEFAQLVEHQPHPVALVIDREHGRPCEVAWCESRRTRLADAVEDLRRREGTERENIGHARVGPALPPREPEPRASEPEPSARGREPALVEAIGRWLRERGLDAAVWTDTPGNFEAVTGRAFGVTAFVEHVAALDAQPKASAAEYVWRSPAFVDTPVRRALQRPPWFAPD